MRLRADKRKRSHRQLIRYRVASPSFKCCRKNRGFFRTLRRMWSRSGRGRSSSWRPTTVCRCPQSARHWWPPGSARPSIVFQDMGKGSDGYAKRFGANMARSASDNLFGTFLIASVMHEDPRFYVRKGLSLKETLKYAAQRLVYTRSDSGDRVINYDGLLGPLASEGLANTYYPKTDRGVGSTFARYASDQGWKFCGNVVRQYWPRINRKLRILPDAPSSPASQP